MAFAANGGLILWDIERHQKIYHVYPDSAIHSVSFSPNGRYIASYSMNSLIIIIDVDNGQIIKTFRDSFFLETNVHFVAFSPTDNNILVSNSYNSIRIWNVNTGQTIHAIRTDINYSVTLNPNGQTLASGSLHDKTIQIWNVNTGKIIQKFNDTGSIKSLSFSPDGQMLASASYETNRLWNLRTVLVSCSISSCMNPAEYYCGECITQKYCSKQCQEHDWEDHQINC